MKCSRNMFVFCFIALGIMAGLASIHADTTGVAVESDQTVVSEEGKTVVIKDGDVTVITEQEEAAVESDTKKPAMEEQPMKKEKPCGDKSGVMEKKTDTEPVQEQTLTGLPPVPEGLKPHTPLMCQGLEDLNIANVHIVTEMNGTELQGNCDAVVSNSYIEADGVAVHVHGNAEVTLDNCVLYGKRGGVVISGNATVTLKNCTIKGAVQSSGNAEFIDGGNNTYLK